MKQLFGMANIRRTTLAVISAFIFLGLIVGNANAEVGNPRVNQVGYTPNGLKVAAYKTDSIVSETWQLKKNGVLITSGNTVPTDIDSASGDNLHSIDFSNYAVSGTGYTLTVGGDSSYPFDISSSLFSGAFYDSLKYFYHNRSGIAIEIAYTGGGNTSYAIDTKLARPAGHLNQGSLLGRHLRLFIEC
jgi:endoglucanase